MADLDVSGVLDARKDYNQRIAAKRSVERPTWLPLTIVAVLLVIPALQFVGGFNYELHMLLYMMMYVAMASSWNILGGYTGYISLGHNVFFCIGGYVSGMILAHFGDLHHHHRAARRYRRRIVRFPHRPHHAEDARADLHHFVASRC